MPPPTVALRPPGAVRVSAATDSLTALLRVRRAAATPERVIRRPPPRLRVTLEARDPDQREPAGNPRGHPGGRRLVELLVDRPDTAGWSATSISAGSRRSPRHSGRLRRHRHGEERVPPCVRPLEPDEDEEPDEEEATDERREAVEPTSRPRLPAEEPCRSGRAASAAGIAAGAAAGNGGSGQREARSGSPPARDLPRRALPNIQDVLKKGQSLPVQVTKEPICTKGPRVTAQISLAGRFLVYMPFASHVGVSRKIGSREQRAQLRAMVEGCCPRTRAA